jgi:hypothetical protein
MVLLEYFTSIWSFLPQRIYFMTKHGKEYQKCLKIIHDFTSKVLFKIKFKSYLLLFKLLKVPTNFVGR